MKTGFWRSGWFLLVVLIVSVTGCSDFDEMKSQRSLIEANKLVAQGDELKAEEAFAALVAKYPHTRASEVAAKQLFRIQRQREFRERREFAKVLDSYRQVLNGYHALYAEYPGSASDLDQSDYFFDTGYLEEITPDGYQVYMWLEKGGTGYTIWCISEDKQRGYAIKSSKRVLVPFERDETVTKLKTEFESPSWSGRVINVQPLSP